MVTKQKSFETAGANIEIDIAKNEIVLLREYAKISDADAREQFISRFHPIMRGIIQKRHYSPTELISRLTHAIKLNKYRPRNLSLFMLAISPDLYNIHGEFDTFDAQLSQMFHAPTRDDFAIRREFNAATLNRFDLAKQATHDWLRRASRFPTQMDAARNATPENAVAAYTHLFNLLLSEFYRECKWNHKKATIVINVENAPFPDTVGSGLVQTNYTINLPPSISKAKMKKIVDEFAQNPQTYPLAIKQHVIKLSLPRLMQDAAVTNKPFFDTVFATFAHEMQHIVDIHMPRMGAMGPQVTEIDDETYVNLNTDGTEYRKTARELSAYEVTHEMLAALSKQNS